MTSAGAAPAAPTHPLDGHVGVRAAVQQHLDDGNVAAARGEEERRAQLVLHMSTAGRVNSGVARASCGLIGGSHASAGTACRPRERGGARKRARWRGGAACAVDEGPAPAHRHEGHATHVGRSVRVGAGLERIAHAVEVAARSRLQQDRLLRLPAAHPAGEEEAQQRGGLLGFPRKPLHIDARAPVRSRSRAVYNATET